MGRNQGGERLAVGFELGLNAGESSEEQGCQRHHVGTERCQLLFASRAERDEITARLLERSVVTDAVLFEATERPPQLACGRDRLVPALEATEIPRSMALETSDRMKHPWAPGTGCAIRLCRPPTRSSTSRTHV